MILIILAVMPFAVVHAEDSDEVGATITIRAEDLPKPYETPVEALSPRRVSSNKEGELNVPPGFKVNAFRKDLTHARWLYSLENGDVLLAEPRGGKITLLRDADRDGDAEMASVLVSDLDTPHGMAIIGDWLYIGEETQLRRVPFKVGDLEVSGPIEEVTEPGSLGDGGGHWTRILLYDAKDNALYIAVGSASNVGIEPLPRASIQKYYLDDNRMETVATGQGGFYGWPYAYTGTFPDPDYAEEAPEMVEKSILPDVLFQSHSAPLGLTFYRGGSFPDEYVNDAFVAFQGSWNASKPTGYKIVRVPFENGRPTGSYQNFATGFRIEAEEPGAAKVWGRPVGLAVAADGSLLVADAVSQTVWRISYAE